MKEFVENKDSLLIRRRANTDLLQLNISTKHKEAILNSAYDIGESVALSSSSLDIYLDDIENTVNTIFDGIEAKIDHMELYCESLTANSMQIPKGKFGMIKVYNYADVKLKGTSYIKGIGIILESSQ